MFKKPFLILLTCLNCHFQIEAKLNFAQFQEEWQQFVGQQTGLECVAEFALLEAFSDRQLARMRPFIEGIDRFPEWVPFRENRVQLADGTEMSASFVEAGRDRFIASQAPVKESGHLFWQMVWEQGIDQIVMTTELSDVDGDELATAYWPERQGENLLLANGLVVELLEERWLFPENFEKVQIRQFLLKNKDKMRQVTHYWYRNWMDNSLPEKETLNAFVNAVRTGKKSEASILAHCAAGVGRTGVFISVYHMLHNAEPHAPFELVARLRWQRPEMVGVLEQYEFCSQVWKEIEAFRMLRPETDLERAIVGDPDWIEGARQGVVRPGHPEGQIVYHVLEVLHNVEIWCQTHAASQETRAKLRAIAMIHDTFKHRVDRSRSKRGDNHHATLARRFAEKIGITDREILEVIEHHDDAYHAWRAGKHGDWKKAQRQLHALLVQLDAQGVSRELFRAFYWCDSSTGDKDPKPYAWFEEQFQSEIIQIF